jgi:hypothetical protein
MKQRAGPVCDCNQEDNNVSRMGLAKQRSAAMPREGQICCGKARCSGNARTPGAAEPEEGEVQ